MSWISLSAIVRDHIETLRNHDSKAPSFQAHALTIYLPAALSVLTVAIFGVSMTNDLATLIATVFSIFTGLLLNLLVLVYSILGRFYLKPGDDPAVVPCVDPRVRPNRSHTIELLRQTQANISFAVAISIVVVLLVLGLAMSKNGACPGTSWLETMGYWSIVRDWGPKLLELLVWWLLFMFVFVQMMILKRVHKLFSREFVTADR